MTISTEAQLVEAIFPVFQALPPDLWDALTVMGAITTRLLNCIPDPEDRRMAVEQYTQNLLGIILHGDRERVGEGALNSIAAAWARRFFQICADNPQVWILFERFTFEKIHQGFRHHSADAVMHRVRWETEVALNDGGTFKISNDWVAFYARKFHQEHPEHEGFFRLRGSIADYAFGIHGTAGETLELELEPV